MALKDITVKQTGTLLSWCLHSAKEDSHRNFTQVSGKVIEGVKAGCLNTYGFDRKQQDPWNLSGRSGKASMKRWHLNWDQEGPGDRRGVQR